MIVVATDGSPSAQAAGDLAVELARSRDEPLMFVTAWHELHGDFGLPMPGAKELEREHAERVSATEAARARARGATASSVAARGRPARVVCELARNRGADLIVIGSHGWGHLEGELLGSALRGVLAHAPCPVLVSPAPQRQPAAPALLQS